MRYVSNGPLKRQNENQVDRDNSSKSSNARHISFEAVVGKLIFRLASSNATGNGCYLASHIREILLFHSISLCSRSYYFYTIIKISEWEVFYSLKLIIS